MDQFQEDSSSEILDELSWMDSPNNLQALNAPVLAQRWLAPAAKGTATRGGHSNTREVLRGASKSQRTDEGWGGGQASWWQKTIRGIDKACACTAKAPVT